MSPYQEERSADYVLLKIRLCDYHGIFHTVSFLCISLLTSNCTDMCIIIHVYLLNYSVSSSAPLTFEQTSCLLVCIFLEMI